MKNKMLVEIQTKNEIGQWVTASEADKTYAYATLSKPRYFAEVRMWDLLKKLRFRKARELWRLKRMFKIK